MIKNKKHINPSDYIKKYKRGGLIPLFQGGGDMDPGMYDPNANIYMPDWQMDENVQLYDESVDVEDPPSDENTNENVTDDNIILDENELQCQICDAGSPRNVPPVNGACPEGSTVYDGKTNPCDAEEIEDTEEQTEGSEDTHITKTERGAPGWHTPDPYDIGPYGEPGDLFHLMGTIHGMGTDLGLWNPGFRGDDTTTTTTVPAEEQQVEEQTDEQNDELICHTCDNGTPRNMPAVDGKCPEGFSPDNGINPCTGEKETTDETTDETDQDDTNKKNTNKSDENILDEDDPGYTDYSFGQFSDDFQTYDPALQEALNVGSFPPEANYPRQQYDMAYHDDDGDGIPNTIDNANEYIWQQMYGGSTPYFQAGGTIDESEYEQDQRQKNAANIADTLDLQGPNTNYLASMNANPNATNQPFIGPQLPQPAVDLDPDGDGINTGIDADPDNAYPGSTIEPGTYDPDIYTFNQDELNTAADTRSDVDFYEPEVTEDAPPAPADDEGGDIACQKCDAGNPVNVAPVDGQCPEGSTPDDGSDPCAGTPAPKDESQEEAPAEEEEEATEEKGEKKPFKPFRAAIKAAEFVNAWSRKRSDRKKKRQAALETSADYVFGDQATDATNKGQYDVNTGRMQPDKQVYARQGKYGAELPKAGYGWGDFWGDVKGVAKSVSNVMPGGAVMNAYADTRKAIDSGEIRNVDQLKSYGMNSLLDNSQQGLQFMGNVPVAGELADLANAGIDTGRAYYETDPEKKAAYKKSAAVNLESMINPAAGLAATTDMLAGETSIGRTNLTDYASASANFMDSNTPMNTTIQNAEHASNASNAAAPAPIAKVEDEYVPQSQRTEYIPQSQRTGRYGRELHKASMGLEWLKNNYPGFHDLTPDEQKQVVNQHTKTDNFDGYSQDYKDALAFKEQYRTHGYNPVISDLPNWLRKTQEGQGRIIIDDEMEKRMRGQLAGGKLDPYIAKEYARFLGSYRGPAAIDYNISDYERYQGWDPEKQAKFNYPGMGYGYKGDLPGKGPFDTISGDYSPSTLAAWIKMADQVNQPKKYKDLDEEAIAAENQKRFNRQLNIDARRIEDDFIDDDYDMSLAYIPEEIEEEEDPFAPEIEGYANVDEELMNRLNTPKEEIVSLPTRTINQIPTASNTELPSNRNTTVVQQEIPKEDDSASAYDFSGENPYEYGTDEYYNWKKAKRSAMFADEQPKKKPSKKENKRAEMFADAMIPQSQRRYGGEEVDLDPETISKLIALGADIEIL